MNIDPNNNSNMNAILLIRDNGEGAPRPHTDPTAYRL
jgi:hypothetical protein